MRIFAALGASIFLFGSATGLGASALDQEASDLQGKFEEWHTFSDLGATMKFSVACKYAPLYVNSSTPEDFERYFQKVAKSCEPAAAELKRFARVIAGPMSAAGADAGRGSDAAISAGLASWKTANQKAAAALAECASTLKSERENSLSKKFNPAAYPKTADELLQLVKNGESRLQNVTWINSNCITYLRAAPGAPEMPAARLLRLHRELEQFNQRATVRVAQQAKQIDQMAAQTNAQAGQLDSIAPSTAASKTTGEQLVRVNPDGSTQVVTPGEYTPQEKKVTSVMERAYVDSKGNHWGTNWSAENQLPDGTTERLDVTASHVPKVDEHSSDAQVAPVRAVPNDPDKEARPVDFSGPGSWVDPRGDVAMKVDPLLGTGLRVVPAGTPPPAEGEPSTLYGYPSENYNGQAVAMSCSYSGLGVGVNAGSYVYDCPTHNQFIGGVSGGPMVNSSGQAVGVFTHHQYNNVGDSRVYSQQVYVTPLRQGNDGKIYDGVETGASAQRCFCKFSSISYSCTITALGANPPCP
jgi:hypothetical protein